VSNVRYHLRMHLGYLYYSTSFIINNNQGRIYGGGRQGAQAPGLPSAKSGLDNNILSLSTGKQQDEDDASTANCEISRFPSKYHTSVPNKHQSD